MELKLAIGSSDRDAIQKTLEALQDAPKDELDDFLRYVLNGNRNALQSFIKGAVDNPKTWWIGVFSLQMQSGMFGERLRRLSRANASLLLKIVSPLWEDARKPLNGEESKVVTQVVRYAFKYHRSMLAGRIVGSSATTFGTIGGRMGARQIAKLNRPGKVATLGAVGVTNYILASYGAAMMAVGLGRSKLQDILFSALTGSEDRLPPHYHLLLGQAAMSSEELAMEEWLKQAIQEIARLANVGAGPVPISQFCSRPENINLKGLCR